MEQHTPHSIEAEMSLLGSFVIDPSLIAKLDTVHADDFYRPEHATIYRAMRRVFFGTKTGDLVQLVATLQDAGKLEEVGGLAYLETLAASTPAASNAPYFAGIVKERANKRRIIQACEQSVWKLRTKAAQVTATDAAAELVREMVALTRDGGTSTPLDKALASVMRDIRACKRQGIPIELPGFDDEFGGIPSTGVVTVLGAPGSGKSSVAAHIAMAMARQGLGVLVFSYEMGPESIAANMLAARARVDVGALRRMGKMPTEREAGSLEWASADLSPLPIRFCRERLTADRMYQRAISETADGTSVFVVDYIQGVPGSPGQENTARIEEVARTCQAMAIDNNAIVIVVSQITAAAARNPDIPSASDCIGGSAIDQVSDVTLAVYRPARLRPRTAEDSEATWNDRRTQMAIAVQKNKQGKCGVVCERFEPRWTALGAVDGEGHGEWDLERP